MTTGAATDRPGAEAVAAVVRADGLSGPAGAIGLSGSAGAVAVPRYGTSTLADLAGSVLASLGVDAGTNPLDLPATKVACVFLVDGLGAEQLAGHPTDAPVLHAALQRGRRLHAGFPSTTATSLTSLGTGVPPGRHGIVGYQTAIPGTGRLLNALHWDDAVDPLAWQPVRTVFERAVDAGVRVVRISKRDFRESGLTRAALRGGEYLPADVFGEIVARLHHVLRDAARSPRPTFIYAYVSDLDWAGHGHGVDSDAWRWQLRFVDRLVEAVVSGLPPECRLYLTGDHGMVDVSERIDIEAEPELLRDVELVGGEARVRYLYTKAGAAEEVAGRWRARLGDRALIVSRSAAIEAGWFGELDDRVALRIGDVIVAALGTLALVCGQTHPREARMVGHHGSLTAAEQLVPLLEFAAG